MKLLHIDLETSGLDPEKHGVVQIAGIIDIDGEVKETFDIKTQLFQGQLVSREALGITGLTLEQIRQYQDPQSAYRHLYTTLDKYVDRYDKADKFYMVGQNPQFDYQFLDKFFRNAGDQYLYGYIFYQRIDLIAISALFQVAGMLKVKNLKLETVAKAHGIEYKKHDALADITTTREIFYRYADAVKTSVFYAEEDDKGEPTEPKPVG